MGPAWSLAILAGDLAVTGCSLSSVMDDLRDIRAILHAANWRVWLEKKPEGGLSMTHPRNLFKERLWCSPGAASAQTAPRRRCRGNEASFKRATNLKGTPGAEKISRPSEQWSRYTGEEVHATKLTQI